MYPMVVPQDVLETTLTNFEGWTRLRDSLDHLNNTFCVPIDLGVMSSDISASLDSASNSSVALRRRFSSPISEAIPLIK